MLQEDENSSPRKLVWVEGQNVEGWGCSECAWVFSPPGAPTGKSLYEMKRNFQMQLSEEFASHACANHPRLKGASDTIGTLPLAALSGWSDNGCNRDVTTGVPMKSQGVSLPVIGGVPFDCSFWPEDDGWSATCERLSVSVRGSSFEDAKKNMEAALQEHIERILREQLGRSTRVA
jgi:hypothetical protein